MGSHSQITFRAVASHEADSFCMLLRFMLHEIEHPYVEEDLTNTVRKLLGLGSNVRAFGMFLNGVMVGMAAFYVIRNIADYSKSSAHEACWYVLPEHRGGSDFLNYLEKALDVDTIEFGITNRRIGKYLERRGYVVEKVVYSKNFK